jgi:hypothetical protein
VIALIIVLVLLVAMATLLAVVAWRGACRRWEQRAEHARIDAEVRRAERRLHGMAKNAFDSMLDVARQHRDPGDSIRQ